MSKYDQYVAIGESGATHKSPAVMIVLSSAGGNSAEVITSTKYWRNGGNGSRWRYITATRTSGSVAFGGVDEMSRLTYTWRDQNSGNCIISGAHPNGRPIEANHSVFTRLDG